MASSARPDRSRRLLGRWPASGLCNSPRSPPPARSWRRRSLGPSASAMLSRGACVLWPSNASAASSPPSWPMISCGPTSPVTSRASTWPVKAIAGLGPRSSRRSCSRSPSMPRGARAGTRVRPGRRFWPAIRPPPSASIQRPRLSAAMRWRSTRFSPGISAFRPVRRSSSGSQSDLRCRPTVPSGAGRWSRSADDCGWWPCFPAGVSVASHSAPPRSPGGWRFCRCRRRRRCSAEGMSPMPRLPQATSIRKRSGRRSIPRSKTMA